MDINIKTIQHASQRYDTVGDWTFDKDKNLTITVSAMTDWRREFLVGIHELIEAALCRHAGISQDVVDGFDIRGAGQDLDEPGEDPRAPYHKQHMLAFGIEMILAMQLGVDWKEYVRIIETLGTESEEKSDG